MLASTQTLINRGFCETHKTCIKVEIWRFQKHILYDYLFPSVYFHVLLFLQSGFAHLVWIGSGVLKLHLILIQTKCRASFLLLEWFWSEANLYSSQNKKYYLTGESR